MRRVVPLALVVLLALVSWPATARAQERDDDQLVLSGEYVLAGGEALTGSLTVLGGRAVLEPGSRVDQGVVLFGGELRVAGTIRGGLTVFGGTITLAETAVIEGDFASFGGVTHQDPGATVQGDVLGLPQPLPTLPVPVLSGPSRVPTGESPIAALLRWQLGTFALGILLALLAGVLVLLLPQHVGLVVAVAGRRPAYSFGLGLLTLILALLLGGILLIACGLGLLVWLGLLGGGLMAWSAMGAWLGHRLLSLLRIRTPSALAETLLGVFALTVLARLPVGVGFLVGLIFGSIGLGAVVVTRFGTRTDIV